MWQQKKINAEKEKDLHKKGYHRLLSRVLSQNSVDSDKIESFLSTDYKDLNDPFLLNDVEKGANIFLKHAKNKSRVGIIGDYDCDGITSTTMLYELCSTFNLRCVPFLPSRLEHGYGLNENTIEAFKKKLRTPPELLFVTDCGTSNRKEIEELKNFGVQDIIIIDHHLPAEEEKVSRNADALISWHFSEDFNEMCACGEVFQFVRGVQKLNNYVDPMEFLSYAAIGTLADSQPIVGDNRIIVKNGLTKYSFDHITASGLNSLINAKMKYSDVITQTDIEFRIAPIINAAGRIETPDLVLNLLIQTDPYIADEMAKHVIKINEQRKDLQSFIEKEAVKKASEMNPQNGVFVYDKDFHIGVVGIVASRVVEETGKPALVIGYHNGIWKGSGRSIPNVNLKEILDSCSHMFVKYGGHAAAVGVTVKEEYLESAQEIFEKACKDYFDKVNVSNKWVRTFSSTLKLGFVNEEMGTVIRNKLQPYCKEHNPEPIFQLKNVKGTSLDLREGKGWRVLNFKVYKDQQLLPCSLKWFGPKITNFEDQDINVYFTFPQYWDNSKRFDKFSLTVVDIERLKN